MIIFALPGQISLDETRNRLILLTSLVRGLGLLLILLPLSLGNSPEERRKMGWTKPSLLDLSQIPLLVISTLLLAGILSPPNPTAKPELGDFTNIALLILCLMLASITEEMFFRSWMLTALRASGVPRLFTVLISIISFASIHLWQGLHGVTAAALSGLIYALFFLYRRNLIVLIGAHALHNIIVLLYR